MPTDVVASGRRSRPFYKNLTVQVLTAILIGVLLGEFDPELAKQLKPLGDIFIKLIKLVIAPVIFLTVVTGISHMGDMKKVGRVGGKALLYFELVTTIALAFGLIIVNLIGPGRGASTANAKIDAVASYAAQGKAFDIQKFLLELIPDNFLGAFAKGDLIPILIIAILFGAALTHMGERGKPIEELLERVSHVFFGIIGIVMYAAPLGALGAMAYTIGVNGVGVLVNLGELMACVYLTMAAFVLLALGLIAKFSGFSIFKFLRYITEELLIVLGTSSSETALPRLMDKLERFGVARPVVGLVVPTGYSFNLDGTSIYMSMATIFIAQAYGIDLSIGQQIFILSVLMVTSKGAAGVTGSGFITLAATLEATKIVPIEGLALLLGVDRFMSEARAITNIIGNAVAAVVIGKNEKAFDEAAALAEYRRAFDDPSISRI
ncbi:C4-dicarboxylate transport protein [Aliidongia dinghuensis]|uniref:C4-dicarboxylate transport protein n=1 Tax=Aliidongia dinghuensis TaxID=1867774 RepID=A0A8J2YT22_9PROT|nr:dicarboxylate/amino acid:cation symporter [Aliidongia dinghuensis]GGF14773.1 C4-dicarboxylate transport protein [Aliidongia dinghuensis]